MTNMNTEINDLNKLAERNLLNSLDTIKPKILDIPTLKSGNSNVNAMPRIKNNELNSTLIKYITTKGNNNNATKTRSNKYLFSTFEIIISRFLIGNDNNSHSSVDVAFIVIRITPIVTTTVIVTIKEWNINIFAKPMLEKASNIVQA
jgi:hypothetical protein